MVSATGLGSGIDIEGLVTGLVNAERVPAEQRLLQREAKGHDLGLGIWHGEGFTL